MATSELKEYIAGDTTLEAFIARPAAGQGPHPAVLIAHDWSGRRAFACEKAEYFAERGFVGIAIDFYGKGIFGADGDVERNSSLMTPLVEDRQLIRDRAQAALQMAKALDGVDDGRVAAIGFCFGGMCVLELARSGAQFNGAISVHGLLGQGDGVKTETVSSSVLCLHGNDDPMVPPEQVSAFQQEMSDSGADWQMHIYGGTMHAFTNPAANNPDFGTVYNQCAEARAMASIDRFLEEVLA
ncbi:dienelactone hydrolase family protein [Biformimicrobium ophioploci]|uniref:Dienelactone hydrolase family protein n=1 Tax=Biformimicrobium ophioploci TaxID=3036711 RepID=A0ABQ6M1H4_9GAMM|nr:dienelactone hydrolase family protein [Microbulbifer sp. NKW57]GMG88132.1 dienelactone hydrolase family protein [Microbulbifer sp. NKW57]